MVLGRHTDTFCKSARFRLLTQPPPPPSQAIFAPRILGEGGGGGGYWAPSRIFFFDLAESFYSGHWKTIISTRPGLTMKA